MIWNIFNDRFYIGGAVYFPRRKAQHFHDLRHGIHTNDYLQKSFNKHGEENFKFYPIEYVSDKSLLTEREQFWISFLKPDYNIIRIVENRFKNIKSLNPVLIFDTDGNFLEEISCVSDHYNSNSSVYKVLYGSAIAYKGKIFIYKDSNYKEILKNKLELYNQFKLKRQEFIKTVHQRKLNKEIIIKGRERVVLQCNSSDEVIKEWHESSLRILAEKTNGRKDQLCRCINSGQRYHGFYWKYKDKINTNGK